MMKRLNEEELRKRNGGGKIYSCPWKDYSGSNYWSVYGHAIVCAARHGLFNFPIKLIKKGFGL